jgi:hypothetical protein
MTDNSLIYILSVLKSLLIVLGTSPKSALFFGYGKCRPMENRSAFTTGLGQQKRVDHTSHSPYHGASFFSPKGAPRRKKSARDPRLSCLSQGLALLTPPCVRRCSSRPLRSGARWLKESDYARMLTIESRLGSK